MRGRHSLSVSHITGGGGRNASFATARGVERSSGVHLRRGCLGQRSRRRPPGTAHLESGGRVRAALFSRRSMDRVLRQLRQQHRCLRDPRPRRSGASLDLAPCRGHRDRMEPGRQARAVCVQSRGGQQPKRTILRSVRGRRLRAQGDERRRCRGCVVIRRQAPRLPAVHHGLRGPQRLAPAPRRRHTAHLDHRSFRQDTR